eukprot:9466902-Pyramimonas_sp.AAC.1
MSVGIILATKARSWDLWMVARGAQKAESASQRWLHTPKEHETACTLKHHIDNKLHHHGAILVQAHGRPKASRD